MTQIVKGSKDDTLMLLRLLLNTISSIGNFSGVSSSNLCNFIISFNVLDTKYLVSSMLLSNIIRYKRNTFDEAFDKKYKKNITFLNSVLETIAHDNLYIILDKKKLNAFIKMFKEKYEGVDKIIDVSFILYGNRITHINIDDLTYEFHDNFKRSQKAFRFNTKLYEWTKLLSLLDHTNDDNVIESLNTIFDLDKENGFVETNKDDTELIVYNEKSLTKLDKLKCIANGNIISFSNTVKSVFNILIVRLLIYKQKGQSDGNNNK